MNDFTQYLSLEEALRVHRRLIGRFGDDPGLADRGALEAALARTRSGAYRTLAEQAAALLSSLARQHAFREGNARTAFACCAVFLSLNGYRLKVSAETARHFLEEIVIARRADVPHIAARMERAMTPA